MSISMVSWLERWREPTTVDMRLYMLSTVAMLKLDWCTLSMDYHTLMKLTKILCMEHPEDMQQMFRRACFNVFAHNHDNHAKNFSFVYDAANNHRHV